MGFPLTLNRHIGRPHHHHHHHLCQEKTQHTQQCCMHIRGLDKRGSLCRIIVTLISSSAAHQRHSTHIYRPRMPRVFLVALKQCLLTPTRSCATDTCHHSHATATARRSSFPRAAAAPTQNLAITILLVIVILIVVIIMMIRTADAAPTARRRPPYESHAQHVTRDAAAAGITPEPHESPLHGASSTNHSSPRATLCGLDALCADSTLPRAVLEVERVHLLHRQDEQIKATPRGDNAIHLHHQLETAIRRRGDDCPAKEVGDSATTRTSSSPSPLHSHK